MCKFHCIEQGGCATGTQHHPRFASKRQQKRASDAVPAAAALSPATSIPAFPVQDATVIALAHLSDDILEEMDKTDEQFLQDMEAAWQLSLDETQPQNPPEDAPSSSYAPVSFTPSTSPPAPTCLPRDSHPLTMASIKTLNLINTSYKAIQSMASKGKKKGTNNRQPKITSKMNATWAAEYKFSTVQLSMKAQQDQACISSRFIVGRQIDLVFWDCDNGLPYELALQWTDNDKSDIPIGQILH
ncbi:hypothetical protein L210DRAFT_3653963 [Boletus edulis BED1]|uniref:Uncharacterized protein n=1 Tax=Boletus edulis BED1 TaxID=1328754 RepID=A0AAD4G7D7_BOLED|nr:hypothetical protein L210DRAFT_3653963 [Boletus edulis BED1]